MKHVKHARSLSANEILELIFDYLAKVSSLRDYDDIIITLADMGKALTSADRCTVWIVSDDKKTISKSNPTDPKSTRDKPHTRQ